LFFNKATSVVNILEIFSKTASLVLPVGAIFLTGAECPIAEFNICLILKDYYSGTHYALSFDRVLIG